MKSLIILCVVAIMGSNSALAQKSEVPESIKGAFAKKYPKATKVKWEDEQGKFESSFVLDGSKMSVLFARDGSIEETETSISVTALPANARTYAMGKGKIKEAARIVDAAGKVKYEAEVKGKDLIFDEKGNLLEDKAEND